MQPTLPFEQTSFGIAFTSFENSLDNRANSSSHVNDALYNANIEDQHTVQPSHLSGPTSLPPEPQYNS